MPQAVRTISSQWGVKVLETSVIPTHFSDWKYSSTVVLSLQNMLDLILITPDRQTPNGLSCFSWVFPSMPFGKAVMYRAVSEAASWEGGSDHPWCQPSSFLNANHIGLLSTIIKTCWPSFLQNKILCLPSSCAKPKSDLKINPLTSKENSNNDPQHSYSISHHENSMETATALSPQLCKKGGLLQDESKTQRSQRPEQTSVENLFSSFQRILKHSAPTALFVTFLLCKYKTFIHYVAKKQQHSSALLKTASNHSRKGHCSSQILQCQLASPFLEDESWLCLLQVSGKSVPL